MKRILFLVAVLLSMGMGAMAQSAKSALQFVDDKGNVIPDGAVFEVPDMTIDDFLGDHLKPHLFIKNVSPLSKTVAMKLDLTSMPNGKVQCCVGECQIFDSPGQKMSGSATVKSGATLDIETEWFPPKGTSTPECWTATLTAGLGTVTDFGFEYAEDGPTVKVKFGKDPSGIVFVKDSNATVTEVERYNVQGQKISKPCKGINIIKLSNGKTVKKVMK
ncbi:MAG: hypothetical protein ACTTI1_06715 [Prevotella intermedia]